VKVAGADTEATDPVDEEVADDVDEEEEGCAGG